MIKALFHLAIPVNDLAKNRQFYTEVLGLEEGRSSTKWVDYNFFGHQFVIHELPGHIGATETNPVDGKAVPVPHFGAIIPWDDFDVFAKRLAAKGVQFIIEPYTRFKGEPGEQRTLFFKDPAGNALEFKTFKDMNQVFATD